MLNSESEIDASTREKLFEHWATKIASKSNKPSEHYALSTTQQYINKIKKPDNKHQEKGLLDSKNYFSVDDIDEINQCEEKLRNEYQSIDDSDHYLPFTWYKNYLTYVQKERSDGEAGLWKELQQASSNQIEEKRDYESAIKGIALNTILYGPPGTGKTYNTISYAVKICDSEYYKQHKDNYDELARRFNELKKEQRVTFTTFHQSYSYEDFIEGIRPVLDDNSGLRYELVSGVFKALCNIAKKDPNSNYVIVIDEINRGNISEIFGELITLIEADKREGSGSTALTAKLPYSKEKFGVPSNVYIVGTMNTADKSLTQIDAALRRRFDFVEMMPDPKLLKEEPAVEGVDLAKLLEAMNARIAAIYDREHEIGHSYLMNLDGNLDKLRGAFEKNIIPLLQEYFYDDYSKICQVLNEKDGTGVFIIAAGNDFEKYTKNLGLDKKACWKLGESSDWKPENFIEIYDSKDHANED